jgi:hypothetical protein
MAKEQILRSFFIQFILVLLVSVHGLCQSFELAGIRYNHFPHSQANHNSTAKVSIQELGGFVYIPLKLKNDKTIIINGLAYGLVKINHFNALASLPEPYMKLHTVNYSFMVAHKINEKWSFIGVVKPTLASDFKADLSTDDVVIQSLAFFIHKFNSNLKFGGGLAYTTRFGDPLVIPVFPIRYSNNKHNINTLLPIRFLYNYKLYPDLSIGLKALINGANFNIQGHTQNSIEVNKINYTRISIGPVLYYSPIKLVALELSGGLNALRSFNPVDYDGNRYKNQLPVGSFINMGIILKAPNKD